MKTIFDFAPISDKKKSVFNKLADIYMANEEANNGTNYDYDGVVRTERMEEARKNIENLLNGHWCDKPKEAKVTSDELTKIKVWRYMPTMERKKALFKNLMAYADDFYIELRK